MNNDNKEYNQIVDFYLKLTKGESIATIGPPFSFYHADSNSTDIIIHNVFNVDIKSAFPTICRIIFGKDHPFVQQIFEKTDKKDRNIFIATTLTEQTKQTGIQYLNEINLLSKMLIFCFVYSTYSNIRILEYVKDGMLIHGTKLLELNVEQNGFILFCKDNNIDFHDDIIDVYMRFNKTSIYYNKDDLKVKGKYHNLPKCLYDIIDKFFNGLIYNIELLDIVKKYYSKQFFDIVYNGGVKDYLDYLYKFESEKVLNISGEFSTNISEIDPRMYLINILYPILNLLRLYNVQK